MSEPRTAEGRALLALLGWFASEKGNALREGILAIEAEATAGHAECEANMDAEIERLTLALAALAVINDVTKYDARRREVAAMIDEADRQDDHPMSPDGLADALMEIALGWCRAALHVTPKEEPQ